jgi:peptidoglycan/xylan/chitin deacetylase (PgdA/CDA1 family)
MMDHGRFAYSPIVDRPAKPFPGDARVALWVTPNIEHFHWKQQGMAMTPMTAGLSPDVLNYAWRDFGARVGVWRVMDILAKHGVPATAALNSEVCAQYPQIVEAGTKAGWEWIAHGPSNSMLFTGMGPDDEKPLVNAVIDTIAQATGTRPRGWLGPALTETDNTLDILAEAGIDYVCDWANDELPYEMTTSAGPIVAMPYTLEIGDIPVFLQHGGSGDDFYRIVTDQFDQLYEEGATSPRVMSIAVHPFLIGHPFRARALDKALAHIVAHDKVWLATGSEIVDWFRG